MDPLNNDFTSFLYATPLWSVFLFTLVVTLTAFEVGFLLGRFCVKRSGKEKESPIGAMVAATLGLLAFMLTFTFSLAASHFDTRRQLVLDEADAIRSCYVMAEMLAEKPREESRRLLREYIAGRVRHIKDFNELRQIVAEADKLQDQLWAIAMSGEEKRTSTSSAWLYIQSLDDLFNMQAKRISYGAHGRIPKTIWIVLYWLSALGMAAMGYHAGVAGKRGIFAYLILLVTFSLVIVLIYDLDRPKQELFKVSQQAMIRLQARIEQHTIPVGPTHPVKQEQE